MASDHTHKIVIKEDGTQSLIVTPAMPRDSGEWTVVSQNRAGRSSISVTLAVDGKKKNEELVSYSFRVRSMLQCLLFWLFSSQRKFAAPAVHGQAEEHQRETRNFGATGRQSPREPLAGNCLAQR